MKFAHALPIAIALSLFSSLSVAQQRDGTPAEQRAQLRKESAEALASMRRADPEIERFFKGSAGYVVFPRIGKAGFIIGGAHGDGELHESGRTTGTATMTMASFGLQAGVQEFSQLIFFEDAQALSRFKANKFEVSANVSAVIVKSGAAKSANYRDGVAVFTLPREGAMAEIALGAQKFNYKPE